MNCKIPHRLEGMSFLPIMLLLFSTVHTAFAQTTAFTYQGKLTDAGSPANATFDMQFKLFDTVDVGTGTQQGGTITNPTVQVTSGIFTVQLDFGASVFAGAALYLEIGVRPAGSPDPYTILAPRQTVTSTPYTIRSLSAASADAATSALQLGGLPASGFIQNTSSQQASTNFNVSGDGTVGGTLSASLINATTQYNIGGQRVLSILGTNNVFAGAGAGQSNTAGGSNSFFGHNAGFANTIGNGNSFFGSSAGVSNTTGVSNSFFGVSAGQFNSTGIGNAFFGSFAGQSNTTASGNSFFGRFAGQNNTAGDSNTFVGSSAGLSNSTEGNNSFIGAFSNGAAGMTNATAVGSRAQVTQSNSLVLGSISGVNGATASVNVGIGMTAPAERLDVAGNVKASGLVIGGDINTSTQYNIGGSRVLSVAGTNNLFAGVGAGAANTGGGRNSFVGASAGQANTSGVSNSFFGSSAGSANVSGSQNAFFGTFAGLANTVGDNSFFGASAGSSNNSGTNNSFFGRSAGASNTTGQSNVFVGRNAGDFNITGSSNTIIGASANVGADNLTNATAIGAGALVNTSNTMVLGTSAVTVKVAGTLNVTGNATANVAILNGGLVVNSGASIDGPITLFNLGSAGSTSLCRNASKEIATCSSSLRYKTQVRGFLSGLEIVNRLRPITFTWKTDGTLDLGLAAEDVAAVEPLLIIRNARGEVEGVKYDRLDVVLINAIKQQQQQIEQQQDQLKQQHSQIEGLKRLVCLDHPNAAVCN